MKKFILLLVISTILSGCFTIIRPGEVGLKRTFGRIKNVTMTPGLYPFNFFITTIIKVPIRTTNMQVDA